MVKLLIKNQNKISFAVNISKILIISIVGLFLIGFFFPFYEYPNDSRGYGIHSIRLSNGEYAFTNELLESTGKWEFVPGSQIKTEHNSSIPDSMPGIASMGAVSYLIGGYFGLFYLGPIIMISILITSERIATKCFGKYVGLLTLIFLVTNEYIFLIGRGLLTSNFFTLFFLIGIFFFIKYFHVKNDKHLLFASIFFTLPTFFRLNGIMLVPVELIILAGYFIIQAARERKTSKNHTKFTFKKIINKKTVKILGIATCPYIIFLIFFAGFNSYYFDDPTISIYNRPDIPGKDQSVTELENLFNVDLNRVEHYFNHFMPYPLNRINGLIDDYDLVSQQVNDPFGNKILQIVGDESKKIGGFHLGIISFIILLIGIIVSIYYKKVDKEIIIFSAFIISVILFYSTLLLSWNRQGSGRDVLPVMPLFYMMFSYLIIKIIQADTKNKLKNNFPNIKKLIKVIVISSLIIFIPISFFYADYSQIIKKDGLNFKDPFALVEGFPISIIQEVPKNGILLTHYHVHSALFEKITVFHATALGQNVDDPKYQEMIQVMKDVINSGMDMYAFKHPVLESERDFQIELTTENSFILKDFSDNFCALIIDESGTKESDPVCLEEWKQTMHWLL